ncbi:MAG: Gfo/Idh/MocA family protein [Puniceicoccaceae bacterium]
MPVIKIGIIGTGGMANFQAEQFAGIRGCKVVAACDIEEERVREFCRKFDIPKYHTDARELVKDPEIDAVSVVTPDSSHAFLSLLAIKAGKHILCEKPLATNYADAKKMVAAARKAGVVNMVNFSYRGNSTIHRAARMVEQGKIGQVRHVHAYYHQSWLVDDHWGDWRKTPGWLWRLSTGHGSNGVLGDIGVHILDFATYPVGAIKSVYCKLQNYPDKAPGNQIGEYRLDANDTAIITAEFDNGAVGTIHTSRTVVPHQNSLRLNLYGDQGSIEIDLDRSGTSLEFWPVREGKLQEKQIVETRPDMGNLKRFIKSIKTGVQEQPDFERGAEIQKIIDACIQSDAEGRTVAI